MLYLEVKEDLKNTISGRPGSGLNCLLDSENIQTTLRLGFCQGSMCKTKKKILGAPCGGNLMKCESAMSRRRLHVCDFEFKHSFQARIAHWLVSRALSQSQHNCAPAIYYSAEVWLWSRCDQVRFGCDRVLFGCDF